MQMSIHSAEIANNNTTGNEIVSEIFSVKPSDYIKRVMLSWSLHYAWILLTPFIALVIAGFFDSRFFIVALMWIFIVIPGIMMMAYLKFGTTKTAVSEVRPHTLTLTDDALVSTPAQPCFHLPQTTLPFQNIRKIEQTSQGYIIYTNTSNFTHISLILSAFNKDHHQRIHILFSPFTAVE